MHPAVDLSRARPGAFRVYAPGASLLVSLNQPWPSVALNPDSSARTCYALPAGGWRRVCRSRVLKNIVWRCVQSEKFLKKARVRLVSGKTEFRGCVRFYYWREDGS